jgi:hypothetical protein
MKKAVDLLHIDHYGILRFELGGRILLLFLTEIFAIWLSFMLLSNWQYLNDTKRGLYILIFNSIFLGITFFSLIFKGKYLKVWHTEIIKQLANVGYFVMIFVLIYSFTPQEIDNRRFEDVPTHFYTNPVMLSYIFILVFMLCFYVLFNSAR